MGQPCCAIAYNKREVTSESIFTNVLSDKDHSERRKDNTNIVQINKVSTINVHSSKLGKCRTQRIKQTVPLLISNDEGRENNKCLNVGFIGAPVMIFPSPTNFKIDAGCFRKEMKMELLEDRYTFEDIIGKGGFGEVRRIRDKRTNACRALKIISKSNCQTTDNFADEIEIIKKLVR